MKKIGLACTGGGIKAVCSIGVIKAFEELGIQISAISGTSIGSCIAVLYAAGYSVEEIAKKMKEYNREYPKFSFWNKILAPGRLTLQGGGKNPNIIYHTIKEAMKEKGKVNMNDFAIPIFIPTLDITTKETVYYSSQKIEREKFYVNREIAEAVKNSCSLPLLYTPNTVFIDGELHQFLDGGMMNNIPTMHLKEFSDFVVGVEVIYKKKIEGKKVNVITGIRNTFQAMRRSAFVWQKKEADLLISVDTKEVDIIGKEEEVDFCIQKGYETTMSMAEEGKLNNILGEAKTK